MCFSNAKGRQGIYFDARRVFPIERMQGKKKVPEVLPADPEALVKFAVAKSLNQPVLFWGGSSQYSGCSAWPAGKELVSVADGLKENAESFLAKLQEADHGFYFLEADNDRDLEYMRGWDFRNGTSNGLYLMLASVFETEATYDQACGRVLRGQDEGSIYTLPRKMWKQ